MEREREREREREGFVILKVELILPQLHTMPRSTHGLAIAFFKMEF
jgi:hypothetical protein